MFFDVNSINFDIISVLSLNWESRNEKSGERPYHALSYRIRGNADFIHEKGTTHTETGEIIFVPAYYEYFQQAKEESLIVIHLDSAMQLPKAIKIFHPRNPQYFQRKFQELYSTWTLKQYGYEYECKSIFYRILSKIEQELSESNFSRTESLLVNAQEYIHENFTDKNLSVDFLAHMCGMSDTYFRRLFVKKFSVTPLKYINHLRSDYAKELLLSGYYNVTQVAEKCGFDNIQHFSSFIKKETGKNPSQFLT